MEEQQSPIHNLTDSISSGEAVTQLFSEPLKQGVSSIIPVVLPKEACIYLAILFTKCFCWPEWKALQLSPDQGVGLTLLEREIIMDHKSDIQAKMYFERNPFYYDTVFK